MVLYVRSEFQFCISPASTPKSAPNFLDLTPFSLTFIFLYRRFTHRIPKSLGPTVFLYCSHHTLPRKPVSCKMKVKCALFSDKFIGHRNSAIYMYSCHVLNLLLIVCWSLKPLWRDRFIIHTSELLSKVDFFLTLLIFWTLICSSELWEVSSTLHVLLQMN